jgi:hypothetical protein
VGSVGVDDVVRDSLVDCHDMSLMQNCSCPVGGLSSEDFAERINLYLPYHFCLLMLPHSSIEGT